MRTALTIDDIVAACASTLGLIALGVCLLLGGCGGGEPDAPATAAEAASRSSIQPVACTGVTGLSCQ